MFDTSALMSMPPTEWVENCFPKNDGYTEDVADTLNAGFPE